MIANDSRNPTDQAPLARWSQRERVERAETYDTSIARACTGSVRLAVTDFDAWPPGAARELVRQYEAAASAAPMLLLTSLSARALRELPLLGASSMASKFHIVLRGHDTLESWLGREDLDRPSAATFQILRRTLAFVPEPAQPAFIATTAMCTRVIGMEEIEHALAYKYGELHAYYKLCGFPRFALVNATYLAAHALVWHEESGMTFESCAWRAGFADDKAGYKYFKRHFDCGLAQLLSNGGAETMIERIASWISRSGAHAAPKRTK